MSKCLQRLRVCACERDEETRRACVETCIIIIITINRVYTIGLRKKISIQLIEREKERAHVV